MRSFPLISAMVLACALRPAQSTAENLQSLSVPWSHDSPVTIGSGLDVDLINQQRFTCLNFNDTDIKWLDSNGAVTTNASIELVSDYKSLANTLGLEVDYKSKADVGIGALKAGGSLDLHLKYDSFSKDESRTVAVVVKAASDYGRNGLRDYVLKKEFADLISSGKHQDFRQRCGTHTVVAEHRSAMVAVVITVSEISSISKKAFEGMYRTAFNAGGSINAATVTGSSEFSTNWKSLIEAASRIGTLSISFESRGGAGISDATKLAATSDPTKIDQILATLAALGTSFTKENSAPVAYLLLENTAFGVRNQIVDASKLETLNEYYLQLSRLDFAIARINGYQNAFPDIFKFYYAKPVIALRSQRAQLVTAIESCVLNNQCSYVMPASQRILYAEDIVLPESITLECTYQRFESGDRQVKVNILTNAAVVLRARARLTEFASVPTAMLSRFGPQTKGPLYMATTFQSFAMTAPAVDGTARVIAQIDNRIFRPDVTTALGAVIVNNLDEMNTIRQDMLNSIYGIAMQTKVGTSIQNTVGPPYGGNCPTQTNAL